MLAIAGVSTMAAVALAAALAVGLHDWVDRCVAPPEFYRVLGVCRDTPVKEVRKAYYAQTKVKIATLEHVVMQEAVHCLARPALREAYDAQHPSRGFPAGYLGLLDSAPDLTKELVGAVQDLATPSSGQEVHSDSWRDLFQRLAGSPAFRKVWQRRPLLLGRPDRMKWFDHFATVAQLEGLLKQYPDIEVIQFDAAVAEGKARSWVNSTSIRAEDFDKAFQTSTIFVNHAWAVLPQVAEMNLAVVQAMGFPSNTNLYLTRPGLKFDSVPHSDMQDIFIFQCTGRKHWKIWVPPKLFPVWHQRGKDGDSLKPDRLGGPVMEVVLEPGEWLYLPLGFAHTTSTDLDVIDYEGGLGRGDPSVHMTVGVETLSVHATVFNFFRCLTINIGVERTDVYTELLLFVEEDIDMRQALPFGFLSTADVAVSNREGFAEHLGALITPLLDRFLTKLSNADAQGVRERLAKNDSIKLAALVFLDHYAKHMAVAEKSLTEAAQGLGNPLERMEAASKPFRELAEALDVKCRLTA